MKVCQINKYVKTNQHIQHSNSFFNHHVQHSNSLFQEIYSKNFEKYSLKHTAKLVSPPGEDYRTIIKISVMHLMINGTSHAPNHQMDKCLLYLHKTRKCLPNKFVDI